MKSSLERCHLSSSGMWWTVHEAEEMTRGSNRPSVHLKGSLPLISSFDPNVFVSPADVQLSEILGLGSETL